MRHHLDNFGGYSEQWAQPYSNIDACPRTTLYEAWLEQRLLAGKLRLKAGKIDANTEFDAVQTAGDFLNSSMGYSPTIVAFPSYPEPKLGFNAFLHPTANNTLSLGVFQTAVAGSLSIIEPGRTWSAGKAGKPGRLSVGYWRLGGDLVRLDGTVASGSHGFYSVLEQTLWHSSSEDRKASGFLQLGTADGRVSPIERHLGAGTVLPAPWRSRSRDSLGIAATWVRFPAQPSPACRFRSELIFETYYKTVITSHLSLVQDFQFAHHPGGMRGYSDRPIFTPRLIYSF